ncbi:ABC transporter permease [Haloimpatiens sp. FM7330]|uniref:ABC transporter permease n=1 Tax=Haloimpatiens sp. FM7330 TaxID=3298610 RepID=UPI00363D0B8E
MKTVKVRMLKNIISIILNLIFSFIVLSFVIFMISHLAPGDPLYSIYGESAEKISPLQRQKIITSMGLDKPLIYQYKSWIYGFIHGNLGVSFKYNIQVSDIIKKAFCNTMFLAVITIISIILFSIGLGLLCAIKENSIIDKVINKIGTFFYCIPGFWLGLIAILIFSVNLKILPSSGVYDIGYEGNLTNRLKHMILPWFVVFIGHLGYYTNFVRDKVLEELNEDYIMAAKARGLSQFRILSSHVLRNILPSYMNLICVSIYHLISGSLVVEAIFTYPGLGKFVFESAKFHDYPLLMGVVIVTGMIVIFANLLADIFNHVLDPRINKG